ncbi:MAG TPA: serine hydrolase, partial [Mycobacterium sp.]|nr:serine hydrolase [Mycobacterium sp.]
MTEGDAAAAPTAGPRVSRRLALAGGLVAGGAALAAAMVPGRLRQRASASALVQSGDALMIAVTDPGGGLPLPTTLAADDSPEFHAVAEALMAAMRTNRIPGAAQGILSGDREEHAASGVASMNTLVPVGASTLFRIGSLTKTYTACAIWHLIDQGAVDLDAPVRTYVPDLRVMDE